jgi:hypothetical protein
MRPFQSNVQLAEALRLLSEARLIDIVVGDDGKVRFSLSVAIANATATRDDRRQGGSSR